MVIFFERSYLCKKKKVVVELGKVIRLKVNMEKSILFFISITRTKISVETFFLFVCFYKTGTHK